MNRASYLIVFLVISTSNADLSPDVLNQLPSLLGLDGDVVESFIQYLTGQVTTCDVTGTSVTSSQVNFYFADKNHPQRILVTQPQIFPFINRFKCTKFIIHGYFQSASSTFVRNMTAEYLKNRDEDCQIIQVDWRLGAFQIYTVSAQNTRIVGQLIAIFIRDAGIHPKFVHLLGHSLGGHTAGFAAKFLQLLTYSKPKRISALDPAWPCFYSNSPSERLYVTDADFMDITHSSDILAGYPFSFQAADFFPHGGIKQPGCPDLAAISPSDLLGLSLDALIDLLLCDHEKSVKYFTESINGGPVYGTQCSDYCAYCTGSCATNNVALYGEHIPLTTLYANYYYGNSMCLLCLV